MSQRPSIYVNSNRTPLFKNNPYVLIEEEDNENNVYLIPQDLVNKAIEIDKMTCLVRMVCLCDCVISFYYLIFGYIYAIIFFIVSVGGYLSTINHRKSLMCCYVIYQYFQVFGRFLIFTYWFQELEKLDNPNSKIDNDKDTITFDVIIAAFLFVCQFCITYFIHKYYCLLPTNDEKLRINSLNRNNIA